MKFLIAEATEENRHPNELGHHELAFQPSAGDNLVIAHDGHKHLLEIVKLVHVAAGVTGDTAGGTLMVRRLRDPIKI